MHSSRTRRGHRLTVGTPTTHPVQMHKGSLNGFLMTERRWMI